MRLGVWILSIVFPFCCAGCLQTKTPDSLREANELSIAVKRYQEQQQQRIERLNEDYRIIFDRLSDELAVLGVRELMQAFFHDAMRYSDILVADNGATLPGRFRDALEQRIAAQRLKILQVDAAIAAARNTYADSYKEASLELARLRQVANHLDALGTSAEDERNVRILITKIAAAIKAANESTEDGEQGGEVSATVPDAN